jgi:predicted dehydrogenase
MALEAMAKGKDVYLEKPMTHTIEEAKAVAAAVKKTGRVLQVGSQTTSSDQWWKARKAIQDGMIGKLLMSQGSYHRNSEKGEWNWTIDPDAGPTASGEDFIDWKMWLGDAPARRGTRTASSASASTGTTRAGSRPTSSTTWWRRCRSAGASRSFPRRVYGSGGNYVFTDDGREVPDTFMLTADYAKGHSLVLSSSMANDTHIPGLIRGHEGTIMMVPDGKFEGKVDFITVTPQSVGKQAFKDKYGTIEMKLETEPRETHMENFLRCVRSRQTPILDAGHGVSRDGADRDVGAVVSRGPGALLRRVHGEDRDGAAEGLKTSHVRDRRGTLGLAVRGARPGAGSFDATSRPRWIHLASARSVR